MVSAKTFLRLGSNLYPILDRGNSEDVRKRRYITFFGATYEVIYDLWDLIENNLPSPRNPIHLLWTMMFLKQYNKESTNACKCGCDKKTFRKYVWLYLKIISQLDFVSLLKTSI